MELQEYRNKIDEIDRDLVRLFCQRMALTCDVARYKKEHALPVLDAAREAVLLEKVCELSDEEFRSYTRDLYESILRISKEYQETVLK